MRRKIRKDLLISEVGSEIVVLDMKTGQAHSLNEAAADCFRQLRTGQELEETATNLYAMSLIADMGLLNSETTQPESTSRREALAMLGKVALLPAIVTVAIPEPTAAQSGAGVTEADCIAGMGCGSPCIGVIGTRVCGAVMGSADTSCACIAPATAVCPCT